MNMMTTDSTMIVLHYYIQYDTSVAYIQSSRPTPLIHASIHYHHHIYDDWRKYFVVKSRLREQGRQNVHNNFFRSYFLS